MDVGLKESNAVWGKMFLPVVRIAGLMLCHDDKKLEAPLPIDVAG
jgi:hypothetical protein